MYKLYLHKKKQQQISYIILNVEIYELNNSILNYIVIILLYCTMI